jgi:hypothetical protein
MVYRNILLGGRVHRGSLSISDRKHDGMLHVRPCAAPEEYVPRLLELTTSFTSGSSHRSKFKSHNYIRESLPNLMSYILLDLTLDMTVMTYELTSRDRDHM